MASARQITFGTGRRPKYGNKATVRDGIKFHSKKEADRYGQLRLLETADRIRTLVLQPEYRLEVNGILICKYRADFRYMERQRNGSWRKVVEDVKGFKTATYRLKKKLMSACHGIEIRET